MKTKKALWCRYAPFTEDREPFVGLRLAVELESVTVEAPGHLGSLHEGDRSGCVNETQPRRPQCGVSFPKAFVASEIGKAGIDTHSGAGL